MSIESELIAKQIKRIAELEDALRMIQKHVTADWQKFYGETWQQYAPDILRGVARWASIALAPQPAEPVSERKFGMGAMPPPSSPWQIGTVVPAEPAGGEALAIARCPFATGHKGQCKMHRGHSGEHVYDGVIGGPLAAAFGEPRPAEATPEHATPWKIDDGPEAGEGMDVRVVSVPRAACVATCEDYADAQFIVRAANALNASAPPPAAGEERLLVERLASEQRLVAFWQAHCENANRQVDALQQQLAEAQRSLQIQGEMYSSAARDRDKMKDQLAEKSAELRLEREILELQIWSICHELGGLVEGHPTSSINYLQRIRELRQIELSRLQPTPAAPASAAPTLTLTSARNAVSTAWMERETNDETMTWLRNRIDQRFVAWSTAPASADGELELLVKMEQHFRTLWTYGSLTREEGRFFEALDAARAKAPSHD